MPDIVLVSGGFDPIHSGHVKLIEHASKYGKVVVLLNSDAWLINKIGRVFLNFKERKTIMLALKNVIDVLDFDESDTTSTQGIKKAIEKYPHHNIKFANGGDRNHKLTPEKFFCEKNKVETLWGIGGNEKSNSSSWILKKWQKKN